MTLASHDQCTGCTACQGVCPKAAIAMVADAEGFLHPHIQASRCVACGACERACPVLHPQPTRTPNAVYAVKAHDAELRRTSSSGGMFSLLAQRILADGGCVYGAVFDAERGVVKHTCAETTEALAAMRGARYVQSDLGTSFSDVCGMLRRGRRVLFVGTPCQVAGLRRLLGQVHVSNENLLLIETVCHAVPSPKAFASWLAGHQARQPVRVTDVRFRDKAKSWRHYDVCITFDRGATYRCTYGDDLYMRAFLGDWMNRPSCYRCAWRGLRSGADMTLGDYWGVSTAHPEFADDRGVSLVLVHTEKGRRYFEESRTACEVQTSTYGQAVAGNPALVASPNCPRGRRRFFRLLSHKGFEVAARTVMAPSMGDWIRFYFRRMGQKLHWVAE